MAGIVISDASPVIGLSIVNGLTWLPELFGEVWLPEQVKREVLPSSKVKGVKAIQQALDNKWLKTWPRQIEPLKGINLDEGESACINLAHSLSDPALLIIDEKAGRAVAREFGIAVVGTAAIIGMTKQRGLIDSAKDVFTSLHNADFRIAPAVIRTVLDQVGE